MKNLREKFQDPNSTKVLDSLEEHTDTFSKHPLLMKMLSGELPMTDFARYTKERLDAGESFTSFLSSIEELARNMKGWEDVAEALRENLDDELGLVNGEHVPSASHDVWRKTYRSGVNRVLQPMDLNVDAIKKNKKCSGHDYEFFMEQWTDPPGSRAKDLPSKVGGFAILEAMLEKEFRAQHAYIRERLNTLTKEERLYIDHHAGHEQSHADEIAEPLLARCAESPHIVPAVLAGIQFMFRLRHDVLLAPFDATVRRKQRNQNLYRVGKDPLIWRWP